MSPRTNDDTTADAEPRADTGAGPRALRAREPTAPAPHRGDREASGEERAVRGRAGDGRSAGRSEAAGRPAVAGAVRRSAAPACGSARRLCRRVGRRAHRRGHRVSGRSGTAGPPPSPRPRRVARAARQRGSRREHRLSPGPSARRSPRTSAAGPPSASPMSSRPAPRATPPGIRRPQQALKRSLRAAPRQRPGARRDGRPRRRPARLHGALAVRGPRPEAEPLQRARPVLPYRRPRRTRPLRRGVEGRRPGRRPPPGRARLHPLRLRPRAARRRHDRPPGAGAGAGHRDLAAATSRTWPPRSANSPGTRASTRPPSPYYARALAADDTYLPALEGRARAQAAQR